LICKTQTNKHWTSYGTGRRTRRFWILGVALAAALIGGQTAFANPFGVNITIADAMGAGTAGSVGREDNETEPGTVQHQIWDLEGFFLNGNSLSMIGGYDFSQGQTASGHTYTSGDIFIETNDVVWDINDINAAAAMDPNTGLSNRSTFANAVGWDYAIRMDFANNSYAVMQLTSSTMLQDTTDVNGSNPWRVADPFVAAYTGSLLFSSGLTGSQTGFLGWQGTSTHYAVEGIDLSFLGGGQQFLTHFTLECGNDLLTGQSSTGVPEPGILVLLGIGLAGVAWRKRAGL
jgi:hypothetical protein